jgi:dTDP-4-dehydrorhamnose 3,5-epimerase-like enzyme
LVKVPLHADERGSLCFLQSPDHVPFVVKRVFYFYDVPPGGERGGHAHREQQQLLIMMAGRCRVTAHDGREAKAVELDTPSKALYVPPGVWLDLDGFSAGAVCLVLTSDVFTEADYIRDRAEFDRLYRD